MWDDIILIGRYLFPQLITEFSIASTPPSRTFLHLVYRHLHGKISNSIDRLYASSTGPFVLQDSLGEYCCMATSSTLHDNTLYYIKKQYKPTTFKIRTLQIVSSFVVQLLLATSELSVATGRY